MPSVDAILGEGPGIPDHSAETWVWLLSMWPTGEVPRDPELTIMSASLTNRVHWRIRENPDLALEIVITGHRPRVGDILRIEWGQPPDDNRSDWIVRSVHRAKDPSAEEMNRRWEDECDCVRLMGEDDHNESYSAMEDGFRRTIESLSQQVRELQRELRYSQIEPNRDSMLDALRYQNEELLRRVNSVEETRRDLRDTDRDRYRAFMERMRPRPADDGTGEPPPGPINC